MLWKELEKPWIQTLLAGGLGGVILALCLQFPNTRAMMALVSNALWWPEYPAVELRRGVAALYQWTAERRVLQERLEVLEGENLRLRAALGSQNVALSPDGIGTVSARVTLRSPHRWWQEIRIDVGRRRGIRPGVPVLQNGFLVGRVSRVDQDESWVDLVSSAELLVPAVVEKTRDLGVVAGDGMGRTFLLYIPSEKFLEPRMAVSTALASEVLPPGIPMGFLTASSDVREGFRSYQLSSGADLSRLYAVSVFVGDEKP